MAAQHDSQSSQRCGCRLAEAVTHHGHHHTHAGSAVTDSQLVSCSAPTFGDFDQDGDQDCLIGQDKGPPGYVANVKVAAMTVDISKFPPSERQRQGFPEVQPAVEKTAWKTEFGEEFPSDGATKYFREGLLDDDGNLWADPGTGYKADLLYYKNTGSKTNPVFSRQTGLANNPMHGVHGRIPTCVDMDSDGDVE